MALENNLNVVVSRLETEIQADGVQVARGVYKPLLSVSFNNLDSRSQAQNQLAGAETVTSTRSNYSVVWQQEIATGGSYSVTWENVRSTTNSAFSDFNPLYDAVTIAQVVQPLLQNFRYDSNKRQLVVARNDERIALKAFELQVMDTVRDVEFAYWDLAFAFRDLEVVSRSLSLAHDLLRNNRIQVEVGTMAPIDVLEAEAEVASREEAVIVAQEAIRLTQDRLELLINGPDAPDLWLHNYLPIDEPSVEAVEIDLDEAVSTALSRRPILEQSRIELETRNYDVRFSKNQLQPQLDIVGSIALNGIGGTQLVRSDFAGEPDLVVPGGYGDAIDQLFGGDFRDWSIGLNVSYPLGNSRARAQYAQTQVAARQQRSRLAADELLATQEVRTAARAVQTNGKRIDATRVAWELARRRLDAELKKFEVGMSTSFLIVQAQRDLAQAAANELRALIDHVKALASFRHAKGTILDELSISFR